MLFKFSNLNSNLALTLGYLNPALNNSALASTLFLSFLNIYQQKYTARAEFHGKTLPESPPIKGLFSKCSTNSLKHEKVPIPNLYCEPSHPIWKCFTELAHLKKRNMKIDPAVLTSLYQNKAPWSIATLSSIPHCRKEMGAAAEMHLAILFLASRKQPCDPHIEGSLLTRAFSRKLAIHVCK